MPDLVPVAVRDLIALDRSVAQYRLESLTPRTRTVYKETWQTFVNFCSPKDAWKATPLDVARWMVDEVVEWEISSATVRARLVALNCYFEKFGVSASAAAGVRAARAPGRIRRGLRRISRPAAARRS